MQKRKQKTGNQLLAKVCLSGLMSAIIAVFTSFVRFPTGINDGYLHVGDSMVYLAGCILGPFGILAGAIGGAIADLLAGVPIWAIPTAIIKALNCLPFVLAASHFKKNSDDFKIINRLTLPMVIVSGLITVWGYFPVSGLLYSFQGAWAEMPISIVQATGSAIIFIVVGLALDKANINKYLSRFNRF